MRSAGGRSGQASARRRATHGILLMPPTSSTLSMPRTPFSCGRREHLLGQRDRALQQRAGQFLERLPGDGHAGPVGAEHDQGIHRFPAGQRLLHVLGRGDQVLGAVGVVERVTGIRGRLAELLRQVLGQPVVPVRAAQGVVAVGGDHRDVLVGQRDDGGVEGAAAEVVDEHGVRGRAFLGEAVAEGRGGRLVDDVDDVEPGQLAGQLRGLALLVAEVGGHGDDDVADRLAHGPGRVAGQAGQDLAGHRRSRVLLAVRREAPFPVTHVPLDQRGDIVWPDPRLPLGLHAHDDVGGRVEQDHRRGGGLGVGIDDHGRAAVLVDVRDARVRGAQVDAEDLVSHGKPPWLDASCGLAARVSPTAGALLPRRRGRPSRRRGRTRP